MKQPNWIPRSHYAFSTWAPASGAIAIALATTCPTRTSPPSISPPLRSKSPRRTQRANALASRIRFVASDLLDALPPDELRLDVIVSNPPYVPTADRASLHPQVRDHEPAAALFAGRTAWTSIAASSQARAALTPTACSH